MLCEQEGIGGYMKLEMLTIPTRRLLITFANR